MPISEGPNPKKQPGASGTLNPPLIPPDWDENVFAGFTYIGVRHRILQDVRSKLNINKLRRILKVLITHIITANTTSNGFEGAMLV